MQNNIAIYPERAYNQSSCKVTITDDPHVDEGHVTAKKKQKGKGRRFVDETAGLLGVCGIFRRFLPRMDGYYHLYFNELDWNGTNETNETDGKGEGWNYL